MNYNNKAVKTTLKNTPKIIVNERNVVAFLTALFVLFSLVVPVFIINKIIFILIIAIYLMRLISRNIYFPTLVPFAVLAIFFFGFLQSIFLNCDHGLATQFLLSISLMFLIYPIAFYRIDMTVLIKKVSVIYLIISCLFILYGLNQLTFDIPPIFISIAKLFDNKFFNTIGNFIYVYGGGAFGYRSFFSAFNCMIHIGSTPFLLIPIGIYANELFKKSHEKKFRKLLFILVDLIISVISTSRALILSEIIVIFFAFILNRHGLVKFWSVIVFIVFALMGVVYLILNTDIFSFTEISNSIKLGHLKGYISYLNFKNFLIGDGLASYYYSYGRESMLAHTEITLLDYMRYFGVIPAFAIYIMIFLPCLNKAKGYKKDKFTLIVFFLYILISLTNPVLFNSVGMIVILWYWSGVINSRSGKQRIK